MNFTSFRIAFVKGLFLPEKAPFKTGRIHGFSNRNAADDAEAVQRFCKRNSAKIRGLDRKVAFPTNRRNHGCKTELFLEKFADCLPFSPNVVFLCLPRNLTAALFCLPPSGRSWQNHIPFGRSFSFQFAPQLVGSEKAHLLTPSINQLGTFLPFARKNFCKLFVNGGYNDKKSQYTAHQISGRKSLAISLMKLCTGSAFQKPSMSAFSATLADSATGAAQPQFLSAAALCFISDIQLWTLL